MKRVLNLYSGLGGNRKLWEGVEVTAVENNREIATLYATHFPQDTVIVADAHEYLAAHWNDGWDFIWSSPPCQSHSKVRMMASKAGSYGAVMPDAHLWEEILFLRAFARCPWVVENVRPYYQPIVAPAGKIGRHLFWSNFPIPKVDFSDGLTHNERGTSRLGAFDLRGVKTKGRKDQMIRNAVDPRIGLAVAAAAGNTTGQAAPHKKEE